MIYGSSERWRRLGELKLNAWFELLHQNPLDLSVIHEDVALQSIQGELDDVVHIALHASSGKVEKSCSEPALRREMPAGENRLAGLSDERPPLIPRLRAFRLQGSRCADNEELDRKVRFEFVVGHALILGRSSYIHPSCSQPSREIQQIP